LPINPADRTPTASEMISSSEISQKKASHFNQSGKLPPLTMPSSPFSSDHQSPANPSSSTSTAVNCLSVVSGKLIAGLPEELADSFHTIECYDRLTNKVVPVHASMAGCTTSTSDTELNGSVNEMSTITSPLLNSSIVQSAVSVGASVKPQLDKNSPKVPIQPITLTHKYQENNFLMHPKKHGDMPTPSKNRSLSNSASSGDGNVVSSAKSVSTATTEIKAPVRESPLVTHPMSNSAGSAAAGLPMIPQSFPLPVMFHPAFTPGTQIPFVYHSLTPYGISSPFSALQQYPMFPQTYLNHCNYPTYPWSPSSKVAERTGLNFPMPNILVSQKHTLQENSQIRKRHTPPPVVEANSEVTSTIPEPSTPKKAKPDCSTSRNLATLNCAALTTTIVPVAGVTRHNHQEMDSNYTDDGSSSESEMNDISDSDFEDDMVTCSEEPAPTEGTYNLPPCKQTKSIIRE